MNAFWSKGYEATSMADLCACTGVHKGSLYQTFGDKHRLFMSALKHYADQQFREVAALAFASESPLENIRAAARKLCEHAEEEQGCLIINSIVELAPHDPDVREAVRGLARQRHRFMSDTIARAQELGEISTDEAPEKLARQLMLTVAGGAVMVKAVLDTDDICEALEDLIDSWV